MLVPDRQRRLLELVRQDGSAHVEHLSVALGVSTSTVRRDLDKLEALGRLRRARGGAYMQRAGDLTATPQPGEHAKLQIGRAAASQVVDGMTVMILAGSTTAAMTAHLVDRRITVVTNGLDIAYALTSCPDVSLVVLGGVLHREQMTLLGPMTEQNMADLHVDVMFAGAYGVDAAIGVTGHKVTQAGYHHSMLRHTQSLVVLADASKLGRQGPTLLARTDQVQHVVTDRRADATTVAGLRERGVAVSIC